eukprot:jgi/Mesen1/322/ME1156409C09523
MAAEDALFYGINTGFGFLQNVKIDAGQIEQLQYNLLVSHACGLGEEVPRDIVKLMLMLKIKSLSYGHSGVQIDTVHGASKDAFDHVLNIFLREINSVTDNPNIFPDDDLIVSGGNFHGQPLALALDYLAIAMKPALQNDPPDARYQFLRKGYYILDRDSTKDKLVFNRTVTLKDTWAKEVKKNN